MAKFAYRVPERESTKVDAAQLPLHGNGTFYCTTPGCRAKMHVRSPQKASACFVSYDISEHTGGVLCHIKDKFNPDHYEEDLFSLKNVFDNILSPVEREKTPHHGSGGKGTGKGIAINTLKMLYLMCVQYRDGGTYNGYRIDDILVDKYNFRSYQEDGIVGNRIVACTFWKYDSGTQCIYMNCPDELLGVSKEQHQSLKLHIANKEMFQKCVKKLLDPSHSKISVIGSRWTASGDASCLAECEITSVGKQICKGD